MFKTSSHLLTHYSVYILFVIGTHCSLHPTPTATRTAPAPVPVHTYHISWTSFDVAHLA